MNITKSNIIITSAMLIIVATVSVFGKNPDKTSPPVAEVTQKSQININ